MHYYNVYLLLGVGASFLFYLSCSMEHLTKQDGLFPNNVGCLATKRV